MSNSSSSSSEATDHRGPLGEPATSGQTLPGEEISQIAGLFRLLGDASRVRLLYALLEAGELCVSDLASVTSTTETCVSHALRLLRTARIVKTRRDGRMMHYSLDDDHVRMLLELSREHLRHADNAGGTER